MKHSLTLAALALLLPGCVAVAAHSQSATPADQPPIPAMAFVHQDIVDPAHLGRADRAVLAELDEP